MQGQGYGQGSNMSGKNKDVQSCFPDMNPCALYVPCRLHTWNCVITDAAKSSISAIYFFFVLLTESIQFFLPLLFAGLIKESMFLTLKGLSDRRRVSRIDVVKCIEHIFLECRKEN